MRKQVLLKKGIAGLLSIGMLLGSVIPTAAQETSSQSAFETKLQEQMQETQMQSEELTSETESETAKTQSQESEVIPSEESSSTSQAETSEAQTEQPTQTEIQSEPQTQETVQTSSEADSVEETQENETEYSTEEFTEEESTEEESTEEETTEEAELEGVEESFYANASLNTDSKVYSGWKKDSSELVTLPAGSCVYITSVVCVEEEPRWAHVIFDINEYCYEGYIPFELLSVSYDGDLMAADETQAFPADYQSALNALHQAHPNWVFKPVYVGDTFSYAVNQQVTTPARALISMSQNECFRSMLDRDYNWQTNTWKQWEPNWAGASEDTIRYYMDSRNFLNENDIFMFEALTYESYQTESVVEAALANEFMSNATVPGADYTYAWLFCWIGEKYNINPVALASRVRQEQGSGTSAMISGNYPGYEGLYNYFNIQATGSTRDQIIQNGLKEAQNGSTFMLPDGTTSSGAWDTPTKAIIGGALKFANLYILKNQNTLYAQKFDYDGKYNGKYWHQYMTNIMAPYSEGNQVRRSYSKSGQMENSFVFLIPVYEERPTESPKPAERKNQNNCLKSLTINDQQVITEFDKNQRDFYYYVGSETIYANVKANAAASTSKISFTNVGTISHEVEICNITVTAENGDIAEYRLIIGVGTEIEDGFFDNFDVASYRKRYPQLSQEYGNDLDAYYEHYLLIGKVEGWDGSNSDSSNSSAVYNDVDYSAVFYAEYYLNHYPDLKTAFGNDSTKALQHFVEYGMKEGRQASAEFALNIYKSNYEDLAKAFGTNNVLYYWHYMNYGRAEGRNAMTRIPSTVYDGVDYSAVYDYEYYRAQNDDLARAYGDVSDKFLEHFVKYGMKEGRQASAEFKLKAYKSNYADLVNAFKANNELYYWHYMNYGKAEGRIASSYFAEYKGVDYAAVFDYEYYQKQYADLFNAFGDNAESYLWHFVEYGMAEGRQGSKQFNVYAYKKRYADLRKAFGNNLCSYYLHYIEYGKAEGRNGAD